MLAMGGALVGAGVLAARLATTRARLALRQPPDRPVISEAYSLAESTGYPGSRMEEVRVSLERDFESIKYETSTILRKVVVAAGAGIGILVVVRRLRKIRRGGARRA